MSTVLAKRKPEELTNDPVDEGDTMASAPVAQKKTPVKTAKADAAKKRRTTAQAYPSVQKNTLDSWFGIAKKAPAATATKAEATSNKKVLDENDSADDIEVDASPTVVSAPTSKFFKGTSPFKVKEKGKKLVQRRILLSDQCRVCESAKTESSTRCERKCMDCELTVHMSCYGAEDDDEMSPENWRCRPCQATFELTEDKPEADADDSDEDTTTTVKGIPAHEPRGENGRFHGLYHCSDFAAVFLFLKRFRRLGLKLGADVTVDTLAAALLAPRDHALLSELHTRLLQNIGATISKTGNWVDNVMRFLKTSDYAIGGELVRRLAACGNANDWLETYYDVPVADRVAVLKVFCEAQFDENDTLIEKLGHADTPPESLREEELGVDGSKRTYYLLEDPANFSQGSAWLCRCHSLDGSNWETVADDLASLQSFARALSYSTETLDLRLWQSIANGVAKSLERREKKKFQQSQRLARVPRMLRSSGLDMDSILPADGPSAGRSLRARRAVSYRTYESEDEDDDEDEPADDDDGEEDDDDDDAEDHDNENDGQRSRKRRRVDRIERPTRSSRRLQRGSLRRDEESDVSDDNDEEDENKDERSDGAGAHQDADGESGDSE